MIKCNLCNEFHSGKNRRGMCNKCYNRWYYENNKERIKKNVKRYVENNREKYRETRRKIDRRKRANMSKDDKQKKNRVEWIRRKQNMTEEQIEKRRAYGREYYQNNKENLREQRRAAKQRRRARENEVAATLTDKEWLDILKVYDYRCVYCGKKSHNLTQDHLIPVANGGGYTIQNIVPACLKCNQKKSSGPPLSPVQPLLL